jgi:hypothetical protein
VSNVNFPPRLEDLMARFLARQKADPEAVAVAGEVEPYEAVPAQAVDPRQAWVGACEAMVGLTDVEKLSKLPTGWPTLVAGLESCTGLPMAVGNFPQLVRDLLPLVKSTSLNATLKSSGTVADVGGLASWVETCKQSSDPAKWLLAVGLLRLAKQFDKAEELLKTKSPNKEWKNAFANEEAAIAWQRGNHAFARKQWAKLPDSTVTQFNRGVAELFCDNAQAAAPNFKAAVADLPESSGWHHLGLLYLALAQSR